MECCSSCSNIKDINNLDFIVIKWKLTPREPSDAWWKHFLCYWPFVQGIHWSLVNSPHKGQWRRALMFSLICALTGFIAIREISGRNKISQGQGIVREFYRVSGKFWHLAKLIKKRHGISDNVRENDHFRQRDSPVSRYIDQLAKSRLRNFIK